MLLVRAITVTPSCNRKKTLTIAIPFPVSPNLPRQFVSEYLSDVCIYLETMMDTARQLLPGEAFRKVSEWGE